MHKEDRLHAFNFLDPSSWQRNADKGIFFIFSLYFTIDDQINSLNLGFIYFLIFYYTGTLVILWPAMSLAAYFRTLNIGPVVAHVPQCSTQFGFAVLGGFVALSQISGPTDI